MASIKNYSIKFKYKVWTQLSFKGLKKNKLLFKDDLGLFSINSNKNPLQSWHHSLFLPILG